jgi:hypothetical protein
LASSRAILRIAIAALRDDCTDNTNHSQEAAMISIVRNFSIEYQNEKCKVLFIKESPTHLYFFYIQDPQGRIKTVRFDEINRVYAED